MTPRPIEYLKFISDDEIEVLVANSPKSQSQNIRQSLVSLREGRPNPKFKQLLNKLLLPWQKNQTVSALLTQLIERCSDTPESNEEEQSAQSVITKNVISKDNVKRAINFKKVSIPASQVEDLTKISDLNPRNHNALTRFDVEDILLTLPTLGQQEYAYAVKVNGKYEIFEGARRRFANQYLYKEKALETDYLVAYTEEEFSFDDFYAFDQVTESKCTRNPLEMGRYWIKQMINFGYDHLQRKSIQQFCIDHSYAFETVRKYVKFDDLCESSYSVAISPTRLSYNQLRALKEISNHLSKGSNKERNKFDSFVSKMKSEVNEEYLKPEMKNKLAIEKANMYLFGPKETKVKRERSVWVSSDNPKSKIAFVESELPNGEIQLTLNLNNIDSETQKQLESEITKLLLEHMK